MAWLVSMQNVVISLVSISNLFGQMLKKNELSEDLMYAVITLFEMLFVELFSYYINVFIIFLQWD